MAARFDNKAYSAGLRTLENWLILPQGGVMRRPPFAWVDTLAGAPANVRLGRFAFSRGQEYLLAFTNNSVVIYRNSAKVATVATTYLAAELQGLRFFTSDDTMIIVHVNHPPAQLVRMGSDASWSLSNCVFVNYPVYRFNQLQTCTPSALTGAVTLTLSGSNNYWTAGHVGTIVEVNQGVATITSITSGLIANATFVSTLPAIVTTADAAWSEQAFSTAHGWPITAIIHQNRLVFGGVRDAPSTIFASNTGDFFNFTATTIVSGVAQTSDNNDVIFTFSTDQQHTIVNLFSTTDLLVFTDQGEFRVWGGGLAGSAFTPSAIMVVPQSSYGSASIPDYQIDLQICYVVADLKEVRGASYQYINDKYISEQFTILAQHLFVPSSTPVSMAMLRSYSSTQANYLFVVRSDGQMAVLCIDNAKDILGWSRFKTTGSYLNAMVVAKVDPVTGFINDTLYTATTRLNGVFVEEMSDVLSTNVRLDCYQSSTSGTPKTAWSGLTQLQGQPIEIIADGLVAQPTTVASDGSFSTPAVASAVSAGFGYTSTLVTLPFSFSVQDKLKRGLAMRKLRAFLILDSTEALTVDGYDIPFRALGNYLLDEPLLPFTGSIEVKLGQDSFLTEQLVTVTAAQPLPACILAITTDIECVDEA